MAADLAALGAEVRGWDPRPVDEVPGVHAADAAASAARGSDAVLSVNAASAATAAARSVLPALRPGQLYADLNTSAPALKLELAGIVSASGALFADVALLAPVPKGGLRTPSIASGPGAAEFARRFGALGMPVEDVGGEPGAAATLKLLRSVFMKGLAAAALESMRAAAAAGREDWLRGQIGAALDGPGEPLLDRLLEGSRRHAVRRVDEMEAACELLVELGVEPRVAGASRALLAELAESRV